MTEHYVAGYTRERTGPIIPNVTSNILKLKMGRYSIAANQDGVFSRLSKVMDKPELSSDEDIVPIVLGSKPKN